MAAVEESSADDKMIAADRMVFTSLSLRSVGGRFPPGYSIGSTRPTLPACPRGPEHGAAHGRHRVRETPDLLRRRAPSRDGLSRLQDRRWPVARSIATLSYLASGPQHRGKQCNSGNRSKRSLPRTEVPWSRGRAV